MAIRVYFDGVRIPDVNIVGLRQYTHSLSDNFKLGSTVCRTFEIDVLKSAVATQPSVVEIREEGTVYAGKLVVDTIEDTNDVYYKYKVADKFILMNKALDWSSIATMTATNVLGKICGEFGLGTKPTQTDDGTTLYGLAIPAAMDDYVTARDFIGYLAEINGGYAYLNQNGNLRFGKYSNTSQGTINADQCSTLKIGNKHEIKRVVYDNLAHYEAGTNSEGDTLYLNPDNILLTDSDGFTIQDAVDYIYSVVDGLTFHNIEVEKCPVLPNVRCGQTITLGGVPTLVQIDWNYNGAWLGGYKLNVQTSLQEETQIKDNTDKKINKVNVEINRVDGTVSIIGSQVDDLERHNIHFQVRSAESDVIVTNEESYTPSAYTSFKGDGMRIYVSDELVAEATAMRFECDKGLGVQDWAIESPPNKSQTLNFYRKA